MVNECYCLITTVAETPVLISEVWKRGKASQLFNCPSLNGPLRSSCRVAVFAYLLPLTSATLALIWFLSLQPPPYTEGWSTSALGAVIANGFTTS